MDSIGLRFCCIQFSLIVNLTLKLFGGNSSIFKKRPQDVMHTI